MVLWRHEDEGTIAGWHPSHLPCLRSVFRRRVPPPSCDAVAAIGLCLFFPGFTDVDIGGANATDEQIASRTRYGLDQLM
jgi:hypothetical protein